MSFKHWIAKQEGREVKRPVKDYSRPQIITIKMEYDDIERVQLDGDCDSGYNLTCRGEHIISEDFYYNSPAILVVEYL